jgi:hypothetical protein
MSTKLTKIDSTCLNIQLIDENACLADSLPVINSNVTNLSSSLFHLVENITEWDRILASFYANSAIMIQTMLNIQTIDDVYISPYTTVQLLSSQWSTKIFSLYYPTFFEINTFLGHEENNLSTILSWLNTNFSPSSFAEGQLINVFVNLYLENQFTFRFTANYQESCAPNQHSELTISCSGAKDDRYKNCNHESGGRHWCTNVYDQCHAESSKADTETYTCEGSTVATYQWYTVDRDPYTSTYSPVDIGASGNLNIDYRHNGTDRFIARIKSYRYKNINSTWTRL